MESSSKIYGRTMHDLFINDEQLTKLKNENVELLQQLHDICVENDIKYSIAYGTMLGAVRHKGYIPWDDDLDVIMNRPDYNKFCKIIKERYDERFWVRNRETDKYCPLYFGKFMKKGTVLTECQTEGVPRKYGIFVDIFVLDYVPKNKLTCKIKKKIYQLSIRMASLSCDFKYPSKTILERSKLNSQLKSYYKNRRILGFFASIMPLKFWTGLAQKIIATKKISEFYWTGNNLKKMPVNYMENLVEYEFEGRLFWGVASYDEYLVNNYGTNYMQLPPIESREKHMIIELKL